MRMMRIATALFASGLATSAFAQAWPVKPVQIIVPFAAGGAVDIAARIFAPQLQEQLKQPASMSTPAFSPASSRRVPASTSAVAFMGRTVIFGMARPQIAGWSPVSKGQSRWIAHPEAWRTPPSRYLRRHATTLCLSCRTPPHSRPSDCRPGAADDVRRSARLSAAVRAQGFARWQMDRLRRRGARQGREPGQYGHLARAGPGRRTPPTNPVAAARPPSHVVTGFPLARL